MSQISVRSVSKYHGHVEVLKDFDLDIPDGEFLAILGPSGCGKTTLLRCIAGLEPIQGGEIHIGDRVVSKARWMLPPEKRELGLIFQSYALWPHMRIRDNIAYGLKVRGWKRDQIRERVAEVLELVGLGGFGHRFPSELSGGQMQRVAVARSIAPNPLVLLFDEPLSNLDARLREKMRFELRELHEEIGITALYVTHDQGEAMAISDRIVVMDANGIVQIGDGRELYESPRTRFVAEFIGMSNFLAAKASGPAGEGDLVDLVLEDGTPLRGVGREDGSNDVIVSIRPECVGIAADGAPGPDGMIELPGVVEDIVYLGGVVDSFVRVGSHRLRSQAVAAQLAGVTTGMSVSVRLDPRTIRVLPE